MTQQIKSVGVIGLGTMGAGIVEVFVKAGIPVVAVDGTKELAQRGKGFLTGSLDRQIKRGKLDEAGRDEIVSRATFSDRLSDLADVDLVIEAVPERLEIKTSIFTELDGIVRPDAVLATNTSSLSITQIAAATEHPERVIGMHFFNPAPVLALVEVITTILVDQKLVEAVRDLAVTLGKKPVVVGDRAGFVANALLITYLARAIRTYETGHVRREDLDDAARIGIGFPMGPLTLSDLIGLDVVKEVCDVLYDATKEPSAAPPALLQQMVAAGRLGRKTGHGFYQYEKAGSGAVVDAPEPVSTPKGASKVAVIGEGAVADELVRVLDEGGVQALAYGSSSDELPESVDLAFLVGSGLTDCACGPEGCAGGECESHEEGAAWFGDLVEGLSEGTVVAVLDEDAEFHAAGSIAQDVRPVVVRLHAATKAGQVVEIGRSGEQSAVDLVHGTLAAAGLRTMVARDRAGLVVDALLLPHLNDAVKMVDSGYASVADVDTAMTAGCGYPQGPFAYIDQMGADAVLLGLLRMYDETREPGLSPSPLFDEQMMSGRDFTDTSA